MIRGGRVCRPLEHAITDRMNQGSIERLRAYLAQLPPQSQALLMREFERALEQGQDIAVAAFVLDQLRKVVRGAEEDVVRGVEDDERPRSEDPARMLYRPLEPFLVDGNFPVRPGQIRRASLVPVWQWLGREGAPEAVREFEAALTKVHETGASIGLAISPLIAGFIAYYFGWRLVYLFLAVPALLIALVLLRNQKGGTTAGAERPNPHTDLTILTAFVRQMVQTSSIRRVYLTEALFGFVIGGAVTFIPVFLNEAKGLGPEFAVAVTSVFTVGGAVGKYVGGHLTDFVGGQKVMVLGFFLVAPLFFTAPLLSLPWAVLAFACAGMIFPMILPAIITTISTEIEQSRTGVAFGMLMLAGFGFGSLSRLLMGVVGDHFGIATVFYPLVIVTLVGGLLNCTAKACKQTF